MRQWVCAILDPESASRGARRFRSFEVILILAGVACVAARTVDSLAPAPRAAAGIVTAIVAALFAVEYGARLWAAPGIPHIGSPAPGSARLRWALSTAGVIDLAALIPSIGVVVAGGRLGDGWASAFLLFWLLKLVAHTPGLDLLVRVVRNERSPLSTVMLVFVIVLLAAATLGHLFEGRAQPERFGSVPQSLWWAMVTLSTTGYGDAVPHTIAGRVLSGALMLCGFAVLALLAGILASGFAEEVKRTEFLRIWNLVAQVPFLSDVGAIAIADIVGRLRSRNFSEGSVVIRREAPADSMYFIVDGEVEVRLDTGPVRLGAGTFFGEMALLDRRPRRADVLTTKASVLLVLNAADFYQIAGEQPTLIAAIEAEANRRRAVNIAAGRAGN